MTAKKTSLSSDEVVRILEASSTAGVTELQFGDLHVRFGRTAEQVVNGPSLERLTALTPFVQQTEAPSAVTALTEAQHTQQTKEALELDELEMREAQLRHLLITDPVAYERLLMQGELSDGVDSADSDEDDL